MGEVVCIPSHDVTLTPFTNALHIEEWHDTLG